MISAAAHLGRAEINSKFAFDLSTALRRFQRLFGPRGKASSLLLSFTRLRSR
jgi:hypothetical protein